MKSLFALIVLTAAQSGTSPKITLLDTCSYGRGKASAIGTVDAPFDSCAFSRDRSSPRSMTSIPKGVAINFR